MFLRPKKVYEAQKSFLGPPKTQKIDFLKNLELSDLAGHQTWPKVDFLVTKQIQTIF